MPIILTFTIISYSCLSGATLTPPSKPQSFLPALCVGMTVTIIFTPILQRRIETWVGRKPFYKTVNYEVQSWDLNPGF